ncbi:deoxyribonuclease IV [Paenibacillus protaetiae]|uniref:Deoxyribonuclease IV n=1 Tax=Paenibacillus protaetiae TaxID=2509456 RepID=A0A4V0YF06_9BACL|nr:deoxyribonuclease IV [Paenibacillus protaetiae]QAY66041.1 deoxyribonuclease IV [Paenibacillus protaetiae]
MLGYHVSIKGGYAKAAREAAAAGLTAFQYFPKNPRSLTVKRFDRKDALECAALCEKHKIVTVAHTPYPTNLAADTEEQQDRTVLSLLNDLDIAESCGSIGIVVHFGVYKGTEPLTGYQHIIACLNRVAAAWNGKAKLLIEVQSGEHTFMGTTMEELAQIRRLSSYPEKLAFCLDSCHLFASGVWRGEVSAEWADKARKLGVLEQVAAVHFNDSLYPCGQKKDRHARLLQGHIGEAGLQWLISAPELMNVPFILETSPDDGGSYEEQLNIMRKWRNQL